MRAEEGKHPAEQAQRFNCITQTLLVINQIFTKAEWRREKGGRVIIRWWDE